jgi:hypothetical protein
MLIYEKNHEKQAKNTEISLKNIEITNVCCIFFLKIVVRTQFY